MSDPRLDFALITQHEGGQCPDVHIARESRSIELGWEEASDEHLWWAVETFLPAPEAARLRSVWHSVRQVVHQTSRNADIQLPQTFIGELQRAILRAFQPSLREIYLQAQPPTDRWAKIALERIPEAAWREG